MDNPTPAIIAFSAKCSDMFSATFEDVNGNILSEYEGYVPSFFPGDHYGDYVELEIDLATGQILNWVAPTPEEIAELLEK